MKIYYMYISMIPFLWGWAFGVKTEDPEDSPLEPGAGVVTVHPLQYRAFGQSRPHRSTLSGWNGGKGR